MDLNVKPQNPQQIGKNILFTQDIWVYIWLSVKLNMFRRVHFSKINLDVWFK